MSTGWIRGGTTNIAAADLINTSTGAAFVGTVTVYVTIDNGTQAIGTQNSGLATSKGNGLFQYYPSSAESDGNVCDFTFTGTGASPRTSQYFPITLAQAQAVSASSTPGSVTVNALLVAALQRLLSGGDLPAPDDLATALLRLNDLIDAWKIEGLTVFTLSRILWTITTATSYTVGSTGTIVIDRPTNASELRFALLNNSATPGFEIPMVNLTEQEYQSLAIKGLTSTYPQGFYYNPTSPLGTLSPYPVPSGSLLQGVLYAPAPAGEVGLYDTLTLPQGYRRFYRDTLAVELAPDFDMEPSQVLLQSAIDAKAMVKRSNVRMVELQNDAVGLGRDAGVWTTSRFYAGP